MLVIERRIDELVLADDARLLNVATALPLPSLPHDLWLVILGFLTSLHTGLKRKVFTEHEKELHKATHELMYFGFPDP